MATVRDIQTKLNRLGFGPVDVDGALGPKTLQALDRALERLPLPSWPTAGPLSGIRVIPKDWLPYASMQRIIFHWTAGSRIASATDKEHYHILIEGGGTLVKGEPDIDMNHSPVDPGYAAHTLNCNGGSIGVALCGMAGAIESPFNPGKHPITEVQWLKLADVLADLCRFYKISVTPKTVLSHAEVQPNLGIKQRGKWDIARLPFNLSLVGAGPIGNEMRSLVKARL